MHKKKYWRFSSFWYGFFVWYPNDLLCYSRCRIMPQCSVWAVCYRRAVRKSASSTGNWSTWRRSTEVSRSQAPALSWGAGFPFSDDLAPSWQSLIDGFCVPRNGLEHRLAGDLGATEPDALCASDHLWSRGPEGVTWRSCSGRFQGAPSWHTHVHRVSFPWASLIHLQLLHIYSILSKVREVNWKHAFLSFW